MKRIRVAIVVVAVVIVIAVVSFVLYEKYVRGQAEVAAQRRVALLEAQELIVKERDCATALIKIEGLLATDDSFSGAWQWKGACEFELKQFEDAKQSFQKVLSLDSKNEVAHYYLALLDPSELQNASQTAENLTEYMRITGNTTKDHASNVPPSFPAGLPLGTPQRVLKSYTETIKADIQNNEVGRQNAVFVYMSKDSTDHLVAQFSSYLKGEGYTVEMPQDGSGKGIVLRTPKGQGTRFTIVVSKNDSESERLVNVTYTIVDHSPQQ